jgi:hypothetical protein
MDKWSDGLAVATRSPRLGRGGAPQLGGEGQHKAALAYHGADRINGVGERVVEGKSCCIIATHSSGGASWGMGSMVARKNMFSSS